MNGRARNLLLRGERQKFLAEEWPRVYATIQRLGLKAEELLDGAANNQAANDGAARGGASSEGVVRDATQSKSTEEER